MAVYKSLVKKVSIPNENKIKQKSYLKKGNLPVIDQGQELIGGYTNDMTKQIICDLPVVVFGDHTKNVKLVQFDFAAGADGIKILQANEQIIPEYLYYGTKYLTYKIEDKGYARHYQHIEKQDLPVPSIDVQERIVFKIEELFSKLDKGVEELNKIKEQLKIYRQAVLKEAFENISSKKSIKELSDLVTSGSRGWAKYYSDKGARFVRITDMTRDGIELKSNAMQFLDLPESVEGRRSKLQCNDILVSITADLGSIAIVPSNIGEAYINQHIAVIRFTNFNQGKFMAWYLKSEHGQKELLKNKRGAGKLGLGLDDIRNTHVPDVDDSTANMILDEIEQKLSVCDKIEQTVNESLQKAESLRQSILKQAFEGKLIY